MVEQWLRKLSLIVAPSESKEGIELSELHVVFSITAWCIDSPATLSARIFNVSESTAQLLQKINLDAGVPAGQGASRTGDATPARIALQAGYEGNFGIIFKGELMQVRTGQQGTDSYVDLFGADGDQAHVWSMINTTLAAGYKPNDVNDQIRQSLSAYGASVADLPDGIPQPAAPRGKVLFGMTRDIRRDLAKSYGMQQFIRYGNLQWVPETASLPGEVVRINSETGMIGRPQQTNFGITVQMLLNPSVGPFTVLEINNRSIQQAQFTANVGQTAANRGLANNLSTDGHYKVLAVEHNGDTRGNDWYTSAICIAGSPKGDGFTTPVKYFQAS